MRQPPIYGIAMLTGAVMSTIGLVGQVLEGSLPKTSFFIKVIFLAGLYLYGAIGLVAEKRPARTLPKIIASILLLIGGLGELLYLLLHKR